MTALHNQFKWKQRENIKEYEYTKVFTLTNALQT